MYENGNHNLFKGKMVSHNSGMTIINQHHLKLRFFRFYSFLSKTKGALVRNRDKVLCPNAQK